jgi:hypothetical protein
MGTYTRVRRIAWDTKQAIRDAYNNNLALTLDDLCKLFRLDRRTIKIILQDTE